MYRIEKVRFECFITIRGSHWQATIQPDRQFQKYLVPPLIVISERGPDGLRKPDLNLGGILAVGIKILNETDLSIFLKNNCVCYYHYSRWIILKFIASPE